MKTTISNERQNEIAFLYLVSILEDKGITLSPKTVKQEIHNLLKKLNSVALRYFGPTKTVVSTRELGEVMLIVYYLINTATISEIEDLINSTEIEEKQKSSVPEK